METSRLVKQAEQPPTEQPSSHQRLILEREAPGVCGVFLSIMENHQHRSVQSHLEGLRGVVWECQRVAPWGPPQLRPAVSCISTQQLFNKCCLRTETSVEADEDTFPFISDIKHAEMMFSRTSD